MNVILGTSPLSLKIIKSRSHYPHRTWDHQKLARKTGEIRESKRNKVRERKTRKWKRGRARVIEREAEKKVTIGKERKEFRTWHYLNIKWDGRKCEVKMERLEKGERKRYSGERDAMKRRINEHGVSECVSEWQVSNGR